MTFGDILIQQTEVQKVVMTDVQVKMEKDVEVHERAHTSKSMENEFQSLPNTSEVEFCTVTGEELITNYDILVQLFKQERFHAMEMWQKATQEAKQYQELFHKAFNDRQQADAMTQKLKTIKHLQKTEKEQIEEIEDLHHQLKKNNYDLRAAPDKMDEMTEQRQCFEQPLKTKVLVRENSVDMENKDKAVQQLIQEAAVRARKEVDNVREQCNVQIHRIVEELSHLQMECSIKESQIERCNSEKKALERELDRVTKSRVAQDLEKFKALHQRCLHAERIRDDMSVTLKSTESKLKKCEIDSNEELSYSREEIQRLQSSLATAWKDCDQISEDRFKLQQENQQLHRQMNELSKSTLLVQNKAKNQILRMEQEYKFKENTNHAQMIVLEERRRNPNSDRLNFLTAQQKNIKRSKDEATNLTKAFEARFQQLMTEMNHHKRRLYEMELQLRNNQDTMTEYMSQLEESEKKSVGLQKRLTDAEQRVTNATHQLSILASKRKSNVHFAIPVTMDWTSRPVTVAGNDSTKAVTRECDWTSRPVTVAGNDLTKAETRKCEWQEESESGIEWVAKSTVEETSLSQSLEATPNS
ncbi:sodium channel and clathrin linker 1-like isoform X2 [Corythoichthys intestinalis]|uniref:sodium channel and clathrin linker 1-like isoform X2 n=1 Tax=Corythoichthys intestinalis TaxID=161448 RepID=UPI0025A58441|nr:sodium channel and clathrin linker 1-like isoform X2 [Corythoichthys intestinalis]